MSRTITVLIVVSLLVALTACGESSDKNRSEFKQTTAPSGVSPQVERKTWQGLNVSYGVKSTHDPALVNAARDGDMKAVKSLLDKGASVNARDEDFGTTPLMNAAQYGHTDIVRLLLKKGADANAKTNNVGSTALMDAAQHGHTDIVRLLLDGGAEVNAEDVWGATALKNAVRDGHADVVELLLDRGADVKGNRGKAILAIATGRGYDEIVKLLKDAGAEE